MLLRTALIGLAALSLIACQSTPAEQAVLPTDAQAAAQAEQAEPQATTLPPRLTVLPDSAVPLTIADAEAALSGHMVDGTTARGSYYITRYNPDGTGTVVLQDGEAYPIFWRINDGLFCTTYATEECGSVYLVDGWYVIAANGTVLAHQRVIDGATLPDWALAGLN